MKKKITLILVIIILIFVIYFAYTYLVFKSYINNTIKYKDKINYSTNIQLGMNYYNSSSKIEYDVIKSSNIKKVQIDYYTDNELTSNIYKYIVSKDDNDEVYVYDGKSYNKKSNDSEDFNINYNMIKNKAKQIRKVSKGEYVFKMNAYDAYNMIYSKEILTKEDINKVIDIRLIIDEKNNFVKEISYEIKNLNNSKDSKISLDYDVKIINRDINNQNNIKLPF